MREIKNKRLGTAVIISLAFIFVGGFVYYTRYSYKPKRKQQEHKCPPCKCECKEKKLAERPRPKPRVRASGKVKPLKIKRSAIEREAVSLFLAWLEECKKRSKQVHVNLLACVRWYKLHKYLGVDYADEAMIARRQIGHLILDRLGRDLCTRKGVKSKNRYFVTRELAAVYSNARENIRQLKHLKRKHPSLKIPDMKMCILKEGKLVWDLP